MQSGNISKKTLNLTLLSLTGLCTSQLTYANSPLLQSDNLKKIIPSAQSSPQIVLAQTDEPENSQPDETLEAVKDQAEKTENSWEEAKTTASDKASELREKKDETVDHAVDTTKEKVGQLKEKKDEFVDNAVDKTKSLFGFGKEKAQEIKEQPTPEVQSIESIPQMISPRPHAVCVVTSPFIEKSDMLLLPWEFRPTKFPWQIIAKPLLNDLDQDFYQPLEAKNDNDEAFALVKTQALAMIRQDIQTLALLEPIKQQSPESFEELDPKIRTLLDEEILEALLSQSAELLFANESLDCLLVQAQLKAVKLPHYKLSLAYLLLASGLVSVDDLLDGLQSIGVNPVPLQTKREEPANASLQVLQILDILRTLQLFINHEELGECLNLPI
jgi:hypothetical protein